MTYEKLVEYLIKSGKATKEELVEAGLVGDDSKPLASIAHTMFCSRDHNSDCDFYNEDIFDTAWEMPEHRLWLGWVEGLGVSQKNLKRVFAFISEHKDLAEDFRKVVLSIPKLQLPEL
jgi:hypothetical protein